MPQVAPFSMLSLLSASLALAGTVGRDGRLEQPPPSVGRELRDLKDNPYVCEEGVETAKEEWKVFGTNLGGWLVLEPWITPSLFYQFLSVDRKFGKEAPAHTGMDTYSFCAALGPKEGNKQLRRHWASWVREEDVTRLMCTLARHLPIFHRSAAPPADHHVEQQQLLHSASDLLLRRGACRRQQLQPQHQYLQQQHQLRPRAAGAPWSWISSLYLDSDDFACYTRRQRRDEAAEEAERLGIEVLVLDRFRRWFWRWFGLLRHVQGAELARLHEHQWRHDAVTRVALKACKSQSMNLFMADATRSAYDHQGVPIGSTSMLA